jgi:hypothetical protein
VPSGHCHKYNGVLQALQHHHPPCFGASVTARALDYRMGTEWNADGLAAFVELLGDLRKLDPGARLAAAAELDLMAESVQQRFQRAIDRYFASTE